MARDAPPEGDPDQEILEKVLEAVPDPLFVVGLPERVFLRCSNCAEEMFGYETGELVGRSTRVIHVDDEHYERFHELTAAVLERGEVARLEFLLRRKDGTTFPTSQSVAVIRGENGEFRRAVSVVRDISERRAAEERLQSAARLEAVGRLSGGIAHDFNNLLAVMIGSAELGLEDPTAVEETLRQIVKSAERGASLTRQLLAFSRKQILEPRSIDFRELVREVEQMVGRLLGDRVVLSVEVPAEPVWVRADPSQLQQVVLNLILNARDAMPEGGNVVARLGRDGAGDAGHAVLEVEDTGVGMDAETQARIFEPFFSTKEVGKGTGLGLATAYGFVHQSEGQIEVRSEPGRGSCFRVALPLSDPCPPSPEGEVHAQEGAIGAGRVLVVEDDAELRQVTERLLLRGGMQVVGTASGAEALTVLQEDEGGFDLLLTDVLMPGMTGPELVEQVAAFVPGLPVVFTSGFHEGPQLRAAKLPDDARLLRKPFRSKELLDAVRAALGNRDHPSG